MTTGWARGRVKWDARLVAGGTPPTDTDAYWLDGDDPDGTPFVAIADMSRRASVTSTAKGLSQAGMKSRNMPVGTPGTLLLAMYASVGEVAFLGIEATWNQALLGITPDPRLLDPRFLAYVLIDMRDNLLRDVRSNTQSNLNARQVGDLWFNRPPLPLQRSIADYLDRETAQIDTLIEEQQRLIDLLHERRAAIVETTIESAHVETSGQRLKHVIDRCIQGWSPQCFPWPADGVETWGVLKAGAANWGHFKSQENKQLPSDEFPHPELAVRKGQLVVSRANTRALVGSAAVVQQDYPRLLLCDKLYGLTLDPQLAEPNYVAAVLGTRRWRGLIELEASGSSPSMQNISRADIENLPMDLPSLADQRSVATYLDQQTAKIDVLIAETERFIELARERRSALITATVTGQIDVRGEVA